MARIKIGIVEDELIIARNIISVIAGLGYDYCGPAISYTEAVDLIGEHKPDLLLLDINLSGKKDGTDVAAYLNEHYRIPFIFLTAFSDRQTIDKAKKVKPGAYLVKPFSGEELYAAIEIAITNFTHEAPVQAPAVSENPPEREAMFIKFNHQFQKIAFADILFVESEHNYVNLVLADKRKLLVRSVFADFQQKLPAQYFLQVHRRFVINLRHIRAFDSNEVELSGHKIPIGKTQLPQLMKRLGID